LQFAQYFFSAADTLGMKKTLQEITVKGVKALINRGRFRQAHVAVDRLLVMGPNNISMLKLKGMLLAREGRFEEEARIWQRIFELYHDDEDAFNYFMHLDLEERFNFYFSDYLPGGGRRFLTQPKAVVHATLAGVVGCLLFLVVHTWGLSYRLLSLPLVSLGFFFLLVLLPWIGIFVVYLGSLREITLTREGIRLVTKLKQINLRWEEISSVYLAHSVTAYSYSLTMNLQPKKAGLGPVEIDLTHESTPIRAPSFFVREVFQRFPKVQYVAREQLAELMAKHLFSC
jgi:tetratricopeptide (TPR) repeat protein